MSWTIDFVEYQEAKEGAAAHTISEIHEIKLDSQSLTGVDYHKQESRLTTVSFFRDTWLQTYLLPFMEGVGSYIPYGLKEWWYYVCRIQRDGVTQYIGYLKRDRVNIDETEDIYTLKLYDTLKLVEVIGKIMDVTQPVQVQVNLRDMLLFRLNTLFTATGFDINVTDNYDLLSGLQVENQELYNTNIDGELIGLLGIPIEDWDWYEEIGTPPAVLQHYLQWYVAESKVVLYVENNILRCVLMKYYISVAYRHIGIPEPYYAIREDIVMRWFKIEETIVVTDSNFLSTQSADTFATEEELWNRVGEELLYNEHYVNEGFPLESVFDITIEDDNYSLNSTGNILTYSGIFNIENVIYPGGSKHKVIDEIKLYLMLNNLSLMIHKDGDIEIINKVNYLETPEYTIVDHDDLIDPNITGIIKSVPSYSSIVNIIIDEEDVISTMMEDYYEDLFDSLVIEYQFQLENNYNLELADGITISGVNYKINSIHLDLDSQIYTIKAWRL